MAEKHQFLSDAWFAAVADIIAEHGDAGGAAHGPDTKVNLNVTDTPFGEDKQFHMGAEDGKPLMGPGHLDDADVTLTTDYATAVDVFVSGNPQAGMQAFMAGKVKVEGDMTKLMAAQGGGGNPAMQQAIQEITET